MGRMKNWPNNQQHISRLIIRIAGMRVNPTQPHQHIQINFGKCARNRNKQEIGTLMNIDQ